MKGQLFPLLLCLLGATAFCQGQEPSVTIIPEPVSLRVDAGYFVLPQTVLIDAPDLPALAQTLQDLKSHLSAQAGVDLPISIYNSGVQVVSDYRIRAAVTLRF